MVEMVDLALLIATLVVVYFVIKIYLVLKAACERRDFPLQGPEMEKDQRAFPVQAVQMEEEQSAPWSSGPEVRDTKTKANFQSEGCRE